MLGHRDIFPGFEALTHFHAKKRPFIKQEISSRMTFYNVESLIAKFLLPIQPGQQKPGTMRVKRPTGFQYRMI